MKKYQFKVVLSNEATLSVSVMSKSYEEALKQVEEVEFVKKFQGDATIKDVLLEKEEICDDEVDNDRFFLFPDNQSLWYNVYDSENSMKVRFQHSNYYGKGQEVRCLGEDFSTDKKQLLLQEVHAWLVRQHPDKI